MLATFMLHYMDDIVLDEPVHSTCAERRGSYYIIKVHCLAKKLIEPFKLRSDVLEKILADIEKRDMEFYMKYGEEEREQTKFSFSGRLCAVSNTFPKRSPHGFISNLHYGSETLGI